MPSQRGTDAERDWQHRLVAAVNAEVGLVKFLADEGFDIPDPGSSRSIKAHCPWGWTHPDGGHEKAFRVYATNTAFCFAGCGYVNPVRAATMLWDVDEVRAAKEMAARYGVVTGDVDAAVDAMLSDAVVDHAELAEALRRWVRVHYRDDPQARQALIRCVSVIELIETPADAATWWDKSTELIQEQQTCRESTPTTCPSCEAG